MTPNSRSRSLLGVVRGLGTLLTPRQRTRFSLLAALSGLNAVLEALAAGFVLALVTSVTSGTGSGGDPVGRAIRSILGDGASRDRVTIVIAASALVFYIAKNLSALLETYLQQRLVHQAAADASSTIVAAYLRVPMSFHYLQRSGDVLRNSWNATELVYRQSLLAAVSIVSETLAALSLLTVLVLAAPTVTPFVVVTLGLLVSVMYLALKPRMTRWGNELQTLSSESLQGIQEAFGAVRDARILGRDRFFADRYQSFRNQLARSYWSSGTASIAPRFVLETAFIVTMVVTVLLLNAQDERGATTITLLGLYGYAGLRLMPSANRMIASLGFLRLGESALDLVTEALNVPQEPRADEGMPPTMPFADRVRLDGVTYCFPGATIPAVHDVTLDIPKGATIGIVGPSGGGKSTLVDLIVGLLTPQAGTVTVDGTDIGTNLAGWRRQIGYVSQSVFLLDDTIRANVAFGVPPAEVDDDALWEALDLAQLGDFVRAHPLSIDAPLGERGVRLSGGQRQRVAVARALYHRPSVLVFDEATAALDTKTEESLTAAIEALSATRTVLIVAHRLSTVRACDRLVLMVDGRAVDSGTFDELHDRNAGFRDLVTAGRL